MPYRGSHSLAKVHKASQRLTKPRRGLQKTKYCVHHSKNSKYFRYNIYFGGGAITGGLTLKPLLGELLKACRVSGGPSVDRRRYFFNFWLKQKLKIIFFLISFQNFFWTSADLCNSRGTAELPWSDFKNLKYLRNFTAQVLF